MDIDKKKILVPVDFSEQSIIALRQSYNLTRNLNGEIIILYVIETNNLMSRLIKKHVYEDIKKIIDERLNNLADLVRQESNIETTPLIAEGKVYEKVLDLSKILKASIIIQGRFGTDGEKSKTIGSNALKIIKLSSIPVITIGGKVHNVGCKKILLPLDLSKETRQKIKIAIEMAKLFISSVEVISVLLTDKYNVEKKLLNQLEEVQNEISEKGVECSSKLIKALKGSDSLGKVITEYGKHIDADLIIIMTQQENEITKFFLGSAALEVIRNSNIPVMSITPN